MSFRSKCGAFVIGVTVLVCGACGEPNGIVANRVSVSPDGRRLALTVRQAGRAGLFAVPPGGGSGERLTDGPDSDAVFSADGARMAFVREGADGSGDIWIRETQPPLERPVTMTPAHEALPVFSKTGDTLWFARAATLRTTSTFGTRWVDWTLVELNLTARTERVLLTPAFRGVNALSPSSDDRRLLLSVEDVAGAYKVYELDLAGKGLQPVGESGDSEATYLPDDRRVVAVRQAPSDASWFVYELFMSGDSDETWRRLTNLGSYSTSPAVAASRESVFFLSDPERDGTFELMEVSLKDGLIRRVPTKFDP